MKNNITFIRIVLIFSAFFALPIASFAQAGSLDLSFGIGGIVTTAIGTLGDIGRSVAIQPDGKIVVTGGSSDNTSNPYFSLVRFNTNGSLDTTFDGDGKVTTSLGTSITGGLSLAIQIDDMCSSN